MTMSLGGMTVQEGVARVMDQLTSEEIDYAGKVSHGEFRGFSALHDVCDANMLLPLPGNISFDPGSQDQADFLNAVSDGVTEVIIDQTQARSMGN